MKTPSDLKESFHWLTPHGMTTAQVRSTDWANTSLGAPESWTQNFKTTLNIVMNSETPMFLCWGSEFVGIYNDSFAQLLPRTFGSQPMGRSTSEMLPGLWKAIREHVEQVFSEARPKKVEDLKILDAGDEAELKNSFTLSFIPLLDEHGRVCGSMMIAQEQTDFTENQLRSEREKLSAMLMQSPIPMCTLEGPEHRFTKANSKYVELAGREVVGKIIKEIFSPEEVGNFLPILDKVYATGEPYIGREAYASLDMPNGTKRNCYLNIGYHPFRAPDGSIQGIIAVIQDVTEYIETRRAVENSHILLNAISEASPDFLFAKDLAGRMIFANPAVFNALKMVPEKIIGHTDREFLGDELGLPIMNNDRRIMSSGVTETVEEVLFIEGVHRTYITNKVPYKDQNGVVVGLIGVSRDVTDLRNAEGAMESTELRYRTVTEALPQLVWGCLPDGKIDYLSQQWVEYTGMGQREQLGFEWLERAIHPDDREKTFQHWMAAMKGKQTYNVEFRIRHREGKYRWFKALGAPLRNKAGDIIYWFGTCTDIEDQKKNEEVLTTINEVGQMVSAELDLNNLVQKVTDAGTTLSGAEFGAFFYNVIDNKGEAYTLYSLSGAPREAFDRFPMPRNTAVFAPTFRNEGIVISDDITKDPRYGKNHPYHGMPEGHLPVVSYLAVPVVSRHGEVLGGLFFGHSQHGIFKTKELDLIKGLAAQAAIAIDNARLYKQSRDTIRIRDEFLSIASHELKTPLTGMKIQTQMFQRTLEKDPSAPLDLARVSGMVSTIDRGLDRLVKLVEDMLDISRIQNGKMTFNLEEVNLPALVQELVDRFRPEILNSKNTIELDVQVPAKALADRFRLEQVFTNLISNAVRYAPGTLIEIILAQSGTQTVIRFRDYGTGISEENQEKIFMRFERLISADKISGMGLGLYICKEIIEGHGGTIKLDPSVKTGACFEINLPLVPGSPA